MRNEQKILIKHSALTYPAHSKRPFDQDIFRQRYSGGKGGVHCSGDEDTSDRGLCNTLQGNQG